MHRLVLKRVAGVMQLNIRECQRHAYSVVRYNQEQLLGFDDVNKAKKLTVNGLLILCVSFVKNSF